MKHTNLKALFTAIANSIRNKTGGTDAIIADDFPEAIDGIQTGGGVDKIQRYIELNGGKMNYLFYSFDGESIDELMAGIDTSNVRNMQNVFTKSSNLKTVPLFNTRNVITMAGCFQDCKALTSVPLFDIRNVLYMGQMFYSCGELTTIPSLDVRTGADMQNIFNSCKKLTECWLRNIRANLQVGYGSSWGHLLTLESLLHLCKECRNTGSQKTLTIGTANLAKLEGIYVKMIDITDDMRAEDDLIDEKYPFVQCESTDEGAMTLQDYMATKMWSLA